MTLLLVVLVLLVVLLSGAVGLLLWCLVHGVRNRVTLRNALRRSEPGRPVGVLAFYGDSLTAGAGASRGADYPCLVARFFDARLISQAVGGATSTQMAERAERAGRPRADVAVIWLGRNNYHDAETVLVDVARVVDLLDDRTRYRVLSVISSTEEAEAPGTVDAGLIAGLNDALLARYGPRFVDVGSVLDRATSPRKPSSPVRSDHVHLNDRGYALVAATVIASVLEEW